MLPAFKINTFIITCFTARILLVSFVCFIQPALCIKPYFCNLLCSKSHRPVLVCVMAHHFLFKLDYILHDILDIFKVLLGEMRAVSINYVIVITDYIMIKGNTLIAVV